MGRTKTDDPAIKMINAFKVFFVGIVLIAVAAIAVNGIIKDLPIWIQVVIIGLLVVFVYSMRNTIKDYIESILKK